MKEIQKIRDQYQDPVFRMALYHLIEKGKDNFGEKAVEAAKKFIHEQETCIIAKGKTPVIAARLQSIIIDCAAALSELETTYILRFAKHHLYFGEDANRCRICDKEIHEGGVLVDDGFADIFHACDACHECSM